MNETRRKVFYSWQSTLPNNTNRGLIEKALKQALKKLNRDDVVFDRDTVGDPGSPHIAERIYHKIANANVVVADVSIINKGARKIPLTCNPNVLMELGYAVGKLGWERIILVCNQLEGGPDKLPFDLKFHRAIAYDPADKASFAVRLQHALTAALAASEAPSLRQTSALEDACALVSSVRGAPKAREFMHELTTQLSLLAPDLGPDAGGGDEEYRQRLLGALEETVPLVEGYSQLSLAIAEHDATSTATALLGALTPLARRCDTQRSDGGSTTRCQYDFYRFLVLELVIVLVAHLLKQERWQSLNALLRAPVPIEGRYKESVGFFYDLVPGPVELLTKDLLVSKTMMARYSKAPLAHYLTQDEFTDADFFLLLRGGVGEQQFVGNEPRWWWPSRLAVMTDVRVPRFLSIAQSKEGAQQLATALDVDAMEFEQQTNSSVERLRLYYRRMMSSVHRLIYMGAIGHVEPDSLGQSSLSR